MSTHVARGREREAGYGALVSLSRAAVAEAILRLSSMLCEALLILERFANPIQPAKGFGFP